MLPSPRMPTVFPLTSMPALRSHPPFCIRSIWRSMDRAETSMSATASSATAFLLAPGALATKMPFSLAYPTSMPSTPVPFMWMSFRQVPASMTLLSIVSLPTMRASKPGTSRAISSAVMVGLEPRVSSNPFALRKSRTSGAQRPKDLEVMRILMGFPSPARRTL
ncbi:MAG: hypothetical protein FD137_2441 [Spirochaetes bacterium]|nr:MAG: hypothetical protein FD137_2441 [Spirochaetota bacterium]